MVRKREGGRLPQEDLLKMKEQDLLEFYFANGGCLTKDGFIHPSTHTQDAKLACSALNMLLRSKSGQQLLIRTQDDFVAGVVDQYNHKVKREVKEVVVYKRKAKTRKGGQGGKTRQTEKTAVT